MNNRDQGQILGREAAFFLQADEDELKSMEERAGHALEVLRAYDLDTTTDPAPARKAVADVLPGEYDVTDLVDRNKAMAELLHIRRMSEQTRRLREAQRARTFRRETSRLFFMGDAPKPGKWNDLFSGASVGKGKKG